MVIAFCIADYVVHLCRRIEWDRASAQNRAARKIKSAHMCVHAHM